MELVELAKHLLQCGAEKAVSYRPGQALLRYADRALWVVEKSARWAVPPALEQDDNASPQPELVRPLPWVFFLSLLVTLRAARELVSLANLLLGQPPVRPADVVMYIQSKRRYLRALKYQGNRNMRARTSRPQGGASGQWLSSFYSMLELTMCFRRPLEHAGNNNTSLASNNDEILVVKRSKKRDKERRQGPASPSSPGSDENTMERLIEKMVDMYGESSDDSEYTLTNATSIKSDTSLTSDEEGDPARDDTLTEPAADDRVLISTPNKPATPTPTPPADCSFIQEDSLLDATAEHSEMDSPRRTTEMDSPGRATDNLIDSERKANTPKESPKKNAKLANGQTPKSSPHGKKDSPRRRDSEVPAVKITPAEDSNNTNGSTEGSYSQSNKCAAGAQVKESEVEAKNLVPNKTNAKSPKSNKTKESKIKAPSWNKKSKK